MFQRISLVICAVQQLFQPVELQVMMSGNENYEWEELERSAKYKGEYHAGHPVIQMFWDVFRTLSESEKRKFLLFLTGNDRVPIHGMKSIVVRIK